MTPEQEVVRDIKEEIAKYPVTFQNQIGLLAENIRANIRINPGVGHLALTLVAAELAAEVL